MTHNVYAVTLGICDQTNVGGFSVIVPEGDFGVITGTGVVIVLAVLDALQPAALHA